MGAIYHPPKPTYKTNELLGVIEQTLEEILISTPNAKVILGGDFNKLDVEEVAVRTGLIRLVHAPTHGDNILDMLMASEPDKFYIKVVTSPVRTDHK